MGRLRIEMVERVLQALMTERVKRELYQLQDEGGKREERKATKKSGNVPRPAWLNRFWEKMLPEFPPLVLTV
jgi:hypothetical protein